MTTIRCPAGQWTHLIGSAFTGMPKSWTVRFAGLDGAPPRGRYREKRWWWLFAQRPVVAPLEPEMQFHRKWINAFYRLEIWADEDLDATL